MMAGRYTCSGCSTKMQMRYEMKVKLFDAAQEPDVASSSSSRLASFGWCFATAFSTAQTVPSSQPCSRATRLKPSRLYGGSDPQPRSCPDTQIAGWSPGRRFLSLPQTGKPEAFLRAVLCAQSPAHWPGCNALCELSALTRMPRFFFDVREGVRFVSDDAGVVFPDLDTAEREAAQTAAE